MSEKSNLSCYQYRAIISMLELRLAVNQSYSRSTVLEESVEERKYQEEIVQRGKICLDK